MVAEDSGTSGPLDLEVTVMVQRGLPVRFLDIAQAGVAEHKLGRFSEQNLGRGDEFELRCLG